MIQSDVNLCVSSTQADSASVIRDGPHVHTTTAWIQFHPEQSYTWVPLPWELETHDLDPRGVRQILRLQTVYTAAAKGIHDEQANNTGGITGRRVLSRFDATLPAMWLRTCERKHAGRCPHGSIAVRGEIGFMPAFVIDVKHLCIKRTPPACRYADLSYVWGTGKMLKHVAANSSLLSTPGSLKIADVPKIIRDAICLVASMGEQYLWADALRIIQDDFGMQQSQIAKMDRIYEKALFTIIAANGDNADAGLPGVQDNPRDQIQEILHIPDSDLFTMICNSMGRGNIVRKSTWAQRAWTMQELLFSGRCLIFTEFQVYWRCQEAVWLEEVALEDTMSTDLEILPRDAAARLPHSRLDSEGYFSFYERLLMSYIQRRLTYPSDLINAFSGICSRLSVVQEDRFFWRLPQSQFSRSLGWFFQVRHSSNHVGTKVSLANGAFKEVPFPLWSWVAWSSTSHKPWIAFHRHKIYGPDFKGSRMDRFQRVIDFWTSDMSGDLVPINELGSHGTEEVKRPFPWQGSERQLPEDLVQRGSIPAHLQPGLLYFWSSIASLDTSLFDGPETSPGCRELKELRRRGSSEGHSRTTVDAVIVCMTETKPLVVLAVEWRDSVAYRLGSTMVPEKEWMALENRQWKFVTLG